MSRLKRGRSGSGEQACPPLCTHDIPFDLPAKPTGRRIREWAGNGLADFGSGWLVAFMSALLIAIAVVDLIWLPYSTVNPNESLLIETAIANAPWALLWVVLGAMRLQLRKTPFRYRNILSEVAARMQALIMAYVFITMFSIGLLLTTYLATATSRPLLDSYLAASDATLGFDWIAFVRLLNSHPTIAYWLSTAYNSLYLQLLVLPAILALTGRSARLEEFTAQFGLAGCLTCLVMIAVPAAGTFDFYRPAPDLLSSFGPGASTRHLEQLHQLRMLKPFLIEHPEGLSLIHI